MTGNERSKLAQTAADAIKAKLPKKDVGYVLIVHDFSPKEEGSRGTSVRSNFAISELPDVFNYSISDLMSAEIGIGNVDVKQVGNEPNEAFARSETNKALTQDEVDQRRATPLDDVLAGLMEGR